MVAQSTMEAEYLVLSEAVKESIWIRRLIRELETGEVPREAVDLADYHEKEMALQWELRTERESWKRTPVSSMVSDTPQQISVDNQSCIRFTENVYGNMKAKHIETRYHFTRDAWVDGKISLVYEPTGTMIADIMAKVLPKDRHWFLTRAMGVITREFTGQVGV